MTLLAPLPVPVSPQDAPTEGAEYLEVPDAYLLATSVYEPEEAIEWPAHAHAEHELLWSDRGVVKMLAGGRQWTVTPGIGLWIPAGTEHEGTARDRTSVRATYFSPSAWTRAWNDPVAVRLNPAVRALLIHLKSARMTVEQRTRAQRVCIDMLDRTDAVQLDVPLPQDPRLTRLVESILADPANDLSLEQWAGLLSMTSRTLTRAFVAEVAMSFAKWRTLVRMGEAVALLADGESVKVVARRVGYQSTSAFVAAFHKTMGTTPADLAARL